jgi:hypothetical protein
LQLEEWVNIGEQNECLVLQPIQNADMEVHLKSLGVLQCPKKFFAHEPCRPGLFMLMKAFISYYNCMLIFSGTGTFEGFEPLLFHCFS